MGHRLTVAEAVLQLSKRLCDQGLDLACGIERIKVRTHLPTMIIIDKTDDLFGAADRDKCMQYIIAVVLLKGTFIDAADYQDASAWASDPRITNLREKIRSAATAISVLLGNGS